MLTKIRGAIASASLAAALLALAMTPTPGPAEEANTFVMKDFHFAPMTVTVKTGTTVSWKNEDEEPHTVVSNDGLFRSGALDTNDTFTHKFDKPGTYAFVCSIHPRMTGTIVVQ